MELFHGRQPIGDESCEVVSHGKVTGTIKCTNLFDVTDETIIVVNVMNDLTSQLKSSQRMASLFSILRSVEFYSHIIWKKYTLTFNQN